MIVLASVMRPASSPVDRGPMSSFSPFSFSSKSLATVILACLLL